MDIDQIIKLVLDKKFHTDKLWYQYALVRPRDESVPFEDPIKELKGILTEFVVYEFLNTSQQLCKFIALIYTTFDTAIKLYTKNKGYNENDIFFIYKGGNILRFVSNKVFYMLPGKVKDDLIAYYKDAFKKSDADFSIYINPKITNFGDVLDDITLMSYLVLNHLRNIFIENSKEYFNFYNLTEKNRVDLLKSYLVKLNDTDTIKNQSIVGTFVSLGLPNISSTSNDFPAKKYIPKLDYEIIFDKMAGVLYGQNDTDVESITKQINLVPVHLSMFDDCNLVEFANDQLQIYGNISQSEFIVSVNRTTTFKTFGGMASFNLVRTKISFNAERKANDMIILNKLDGELIDVSIVNKADTSVQHFFDRRSEYIAEYELEEDQCKIPFRAYSIEYLIDDLERILFSQNEYPWNDSKYAKRLKRLLFMYYLSFYTNKVFDNNGRINYLTTIKKLVLDPLKNYQPNNRQVILDNINEFLNHYQKFNIKKVPIVKLIDEIKDLVSKNNLELDKFNEFIDKINENFNVLLQSLMDLNSFINSSGEFTEDNLYKSQIGGVNLGKNNLGEIYLQKYLKYKNKYLNTKSLKPKFN
jgi:hypothetical protein